MTEIINHKTKQINFVLIPKQSINFSIGTDNLKDVFIDKIDNSKPVITQFPEITILFDPTSQIGVSIIKEQNKIIIADNNITNYSSRSTDTFLELTKKMVDVINNNDIKSYGFNIISSFDLDDKEDSAKYIKDNFINFPKLDQDSIEIKGGNVGFIYEKGGIKYTLKLDSQIDTESNPTKTILVNQNVHFENKKLPDFSDFKRQTNEIYDELLQLLNKIIL